MKNIIYFIIPLFLTSCHNEPVDIFPIHDHSIIALDTLVNYSDYILGDFDKKFLVSTNVRGKNYSASINSLPKDSSHIQYQIIYKLLENDIEKSAFVSFRLLESKAKLNADNHYKYKYFSDFVDFFNRNQIVYFQNDQQINDEHNVWIVYQNHYVLNNDIYSYSSSDYNQQITSENFNFQVDSIKTIENPIKKVEVYYSFKCIGLNFYGDEIKMENGKGKSTFEYD